MLGFDTHRSLCFAEKSGLFTGAAADATFFQLRNSHASLAWLIRRIEVTHLITTGYTAAQEVGYYAKRATAWTVAPSGGTALTLTGAFGQLDTNAGATFLAANDVRIASTGALTDGTLTLDTHLLASDSIVAAAGAAGARIVFQPINFDDSPFENARVKGLLLRNNEGIVLKNLIAQGAAGVGRWHVKVIGDEGLVTH